MKKIKFSILFFVMLFTACNDSYKQTSDGALLSIDNMKIPDMYNLYSWKDSIVPLSELIDSICKVNIYKYSLDEIPEIILTNDMLCDFNIDMQSDTIFLKREEIYYRWYIPKSKEQTYIQLLVWNKKQLIYIDDQNNDLLKITETTADKFREKYTDFFQLIEQWVRSKVDSLSTETYKLYSHNTSVNNGVDRIVVYRGKIKIEHMYFKELKFDNNLTKCNLSGDRAVFVPMSYNTIIEDYFGYRNSLTSDPYREIKDTIYVLDLEPGGECVRDRIIIED